MRRHSAVIVAMFVCLAWSSLGLADEEEWRLSPSLEMSMLRLSQFHSSGSHRTLGIGLAIDRGLSDQWELGFATQYVQSNNFQINDARFGATGGKGYTSFLNLRMLQTQIRATRFFEIRSWSRRIQPFLSGGVGLAWLHTRDSELFDPMDRLEEQKPTQTKWPVVAGVGFGCVWRFGNRWSLQFALTSAFSTRYQSYGATTSVSWMTW